MITETIHHIMGLSVRPPEKLILITIITAGPMTTNQLEDITKLPLRTIQRAQQNLKRNNLIARNELHCWIPINITPTNRKEDPTPKTRQTKREQLLKIYPKIPQYQQQFPTINVQSEFAKWLDWMKSKGRKFKDYEAAFRNWLRKARESSPLRPKPRQLITEDQFENAITAIKNT